jgi:hypothetical protein
MMILRFMTCFLREAWLQGFPGFVIALVLSGGPGAATGADGLMPAPPSSVEPSGIPTRPAEDGEGKGETSGWLSAQESCELLESPPPSNGVMGDVAPSEPAQFVVAAACEGSTGLTPGLAISVDPSGMPVGRVVPAASGEVTPMPEVGDWPGNVACANAGADAGNAMAAANAAYKIAEAIVRVPVPLVLRPFGCALIRSDPLG